MKKLTKILLGSILSVAMVVSGALAFLNNNDAYARNSLYIDGYGMVSSTSGNGSISHGTYKQLKVANTFTGLRLTGKTGATFDLGSVDIGSSDWAGTYNATGASTETDKNVTMLETVFDPHDATEFKSDTGGGSGELSNVIFTFTQGAESMSVKMQYYSYSNDSKGHEISVSVKAGAQTDFASYRSNQPTYMISGGIRRGRIVTKDFANLGITGGADLFSGSWGSSTTTLPIYYDFNDVALYTPSMYQDSSSTGLNDSYLIRDFDSTVTKYNTTSNESGLTTWPGFTKAEDGSCVVKVTATFGTVNGTTPSSVIITKLGDFDFSKINHAPYEYDVKNGVVTTLGNATFGEFKQINGDYTYRGLNLTGTIGSKFVLGTMNINDTYFDDNWTFVKGTGIIDSATGKKYVATTKGSSFPFFTGSNETFTGVPSDSRSFISFVLNPQEGTLDETNGLELFKITLTEVGKPENFVTYHISQYADSTSREFLIKCSATNNSYVANERFRVTHATKKAITFDESVRRVVNSNGAQETAISLFYDLSQQAAYTDVAFSDNSDGLGAAFRIRDFDAIEDGGANTDYYSVPNGIKHWDGFSEDAEVEISLEMTGQKTLGKNNSVIITSLMGYNFDDAALTFDENAKVIAGIETDLNTFAGVKTGTVIHDYNLNVINSYKFNNVEITSPYVFTESGKLEYFDAEGECLGEVSIEAFTDVDLSVDVDNGSYIVLREGNEITKDFKIGDVVRFIPGREVASQIILSDVRSFALNNAVYVYDTENKKNAEMPLNIVNEGGEIYYDFKIDSKYLNYTSIKLEIVFDRYCKITVIDTEKAEGEQESVTYRWAVDGEFKFPNTVAKNGETLYRGSSTDKVLIAYARKDLAYKEGNEFIPYDRTDGFVGGNDNLKTLLNETTNKTLTYYNRELGSKYYKKNNSALTNIDEKSDPMIAIIPDIVFETIYLEIKIDYEIILSNGNNASSLNFVVKFNKEDIDNLFQYVAHENANTTGNPFGNIFNYVTTQEELTKGGKNIALDKIGSSHWLGTGWDSATVANGLGLYNGTGKTAEEMVDKPGYIVEKFNNGANIWGNSTPSDEYYSYGVDIRVFDEAYLNTEFVFMPIVNIKEFFGSATCFVINAVKVTPKAEAVTKFTNVLLTEKPNETYYTLNDGTNTYYSLYTVEDVQWLATMAGDAREFTEGAIAI